MNKTIVISLTLLFAFVSSNSFSQEKKYKVSCIAFYNLENLYDTINDPNKDDEEFLPSGKNLWGSKRYWEKQKNMSEVISQFGQEHIKGGPQIVGFSEVENKNVLVDLINQPALKASNYDIVHYDSPDRRGVDVGLIYQKKRFVVTNSAQYPLRYADEKDFASRDQLLVSGLLDGEQVHVIVNHWPSRRGGESKSAPKRAAAANVCRNICDSILKIEPNAKIMIMGDFNDDPVDDSMFKILKAIGKQEKMTPGDFFNPMYKLFKDGIGSLAYKDSWNLFDQIVITPALLGDDKSTYKYLKTRVFNEKFLTQKDGNFAGYPFRTFVGETYTGGYSDHFPVYIFLTKLVK